MTALEEAKVGVLAEFAAREDGADSRRKLLIELILEEGHAFFAFYGVDVTTEERRLRITAARPLVVGTVSLDYAAQAMRVQLASAFHLSPAAVEELLTEED